jgi:putative ABC transport system permease protein
MGLEHTAKSYYAETKLADVWLYGADFTLEDTVQAAAVPGISAVDRRMAVQAVADYGNQPELTLYVSENSLLSLPHPVRGAPYSEEGAGIWLDNRFAEAKGLSPGDSIKFRIDGESFTRLIEGTVYGSEYIFHLRDGDLAPSFGDMGYGFLSPKSWPGGTPVYNQLLLKTDRTDLAGLEAELAQTLPGKIGVFLPQKDHLSVSTLQEEIAQHRAMGLLFPIVFLAIAVLTILTTMTRLINGQRTQIGTLKALGVSDARILRHYVAYGFWISLSGSVLGALAGPFTIPPLFYPSLQGYYTLPEWTPVFSPVFIMVAAAAALACTAASWWACRTILAENPAQTLRPKTPRPVRQSLLEKLLPRRAGFNTRWNLRDLSRNKSRSGMATAGVLGCTMLLVCAFGMKNSIDDVAHWQFQELNNFHTKLSLDSAAAPDAVKALLEETNGQALMEAPVEIKAGGSKKTGSVQVTDQGSMLRYTNAQRQLITLPEDGISLSYKMARLLKVSQGDRIEWHLYGEQKWHTSTVAAIYRTPTIQGITLGRQVYEQLGEAFVPTSILTGNRESFTGSPAVKGAWTQEDLADAWDITAKAMSLMVYILIFAAVVLAVIVLYNLGLLFFSEKERELATLKVLGFQSRRIRTLLLTQNLWLSVLGILLGIPCGKWLINNMIATSGESFDMMTVIRPSSLFISVAVTLLLSVAVNLMFSGKIKHLNMVGALKGME